MIQTKDETFNFLISMFNLWMVLPFIFFHEMITMIIKSAAKPTVT